MLSNVVWLAAEIYGGGGDGSQHAMPPVLVMAALLYGLAEIRDEKNFTPTFESGGLHPCTCTCCLLALEDY